jgi:stage V sporulation protein B
LSRGQSFLKGALILSAAGLGVRLMGAGLKIFLAAVMGDEGIGLYQMAYPVYTTLLAISTAGIPIAVSKLVAESLAQKDFRGAYRVFKVALAILTILGSVFTLLLLLGANFFASSIAQDPRAYYPLIGISPAIFLVTIMSVFRGFFQGQQEMMPTASSQIVEQAARIVVVIVLVYLLLPRGLEFAAAGAAFGAVAGALFSLLFLLFLFFRSRKGINKLKIYGCLLQSHRPGKISAKDHRIAFPNNAFPVLFQFKMMVFPCRAENVHGFFPRKGKMQIANSKKGHCFTAFAQLPTY